MRRIKRYGNFLAGEKKVESRKRLELKKACKNVPLETELLWDNAGKQCFHPHSGLISSEEEIVSSSILI